MDQTGTIGIVGGGQLGRLLTEAALKLGFRVVVVDPTENCPAAQAGAEQIVGGWYDASALKQLAEKADYVTIEVEHIDTKVLEGLAAQGKPVNPSPQTVALIQDKLTQKQFLRQHGLPVADFTEIPDRAAAERALQNFGGKMVLKTRLGGYDGRGNAVISSLDDLDVAFKQFGSRPLYTEQFVPFKKELAVMIARDQAGNVLTYPVTETVHARNICIETLTPAEVDARANLQATHIAQAVAKHLAGGGVFGIEMFLTEDDQILINEIAPRVHNSGHYTIEACRTSQFEQHIRAITGRPLGPVDMVVPAAVMVNILGDHDGPAQPQGVEQASLDPHTTVHIYGKATTKVDRKMGHVTATGQTVAEAKLRAERARANISI